jgi:gamma-glutamyltranspeptidase / glutathione hydrolase / leukotriene-C4 hydrolase
MQKQSVPSLIALSNMYKHQPLQQQDGLVEDVDADIDIRFDNPMSTQELGVEMQSNRKNVPNGGATAGGSAKQEEGDDTSCTESVAEFKKKRPKLFWAICVTSFILLLFLIIRRRDGPRGRGRGRRDDIDNDNNDNDSNSGTTSNQWEVYRVTSPGLGTVATDNAKCSEIGTDILQQGGNAFDAGVACSLCLGVLSPASSGIGGGAFILTHKAAQGTKPSETTFIDSRETAPSGSKNDMFDANPQLSQDGGKAVATLAELKGLYEMHTKLGSGVISWQACTEPAAKLAESYTVSSELAAILADSDVTPHLLSGDYTALSSLFVNSDGTVKTKGQTVNNPKLAYTLRQIGIHGSDYIYVTMANTLATEVQAMGGILTEHDVKNYTTKVSKPIEANIMGHKLYTASGSSSGGAAVAGIVEFMDGFASPLASEGLIYNHRLVEAMKNVFAIRMSLADPEFKNITGPINALTSQKFMGQLRSEMNDNSVKPVENYGGIYNLAEAKRYLVEDHGTSHLSIVDKNGNAIAMTTTVNTYFGSKVVSPSTGIVFNNQMDDFSNSKAPNYFGLHPSAANYPDPLKRPLSSMSPCILTGPNGTVRLTGGASGGPRIITATAQVLLNYLGRGYDLLNAVKAPRLHSQLLPNEVYDEQHKLVTGLEIKNNEKIATFLKSKGHKVTLWPKSMGVSQYIAVDPDTGVMTAVSDPRKDGKPSGVQV